MSDEPDPHAEEWGAHVDGRFDFPPGLTEPAARELVEKHRDAGARNVELARRRRCSWTRTTYTSVIHAATGVPMGLGAPGDSHADVPQLLRRLNAVRAVHMPGPGGCKGCGQPWPCQTRELLDRNDI